MKITTRPYMYIAGPMSGKPYFNMTAFFEAEAALAERGIRTLNPCSEDINKYGLKFYSMNPDGDLSLAEAISDFRYVKALHESVTRIMTDPECGGLYLLEGWEDSKGAMLETKSALAVGLPIFYYWTPMNAIEEKWKASDGYRKEISIQERYTEAENRFTAC